MLINKQTKVPQINTTKIKLFTKRQRLIFILANTHTIILKNCFRINLNSKTYKKINKLQ